MIAKTSSPLCSLAALTIGVLLGFFMVLLYPLLIILWLSWREHERAALLSAAMPSPTDAARCDTGDESTALVDAIVQDNFIADLEKRLESKAALIEPDMPKEFQDWWDRKNEEME